MKKLLVVLLALALVFAFAACGNKPAEETPPADAPADAPADTPAETPPVEKITVRIGHSMSEDNTYHSVCLAFSEKATELLGEDRIEFIIYPNAVLGTQTEMIEAMQMGTLDAVAFGRHSQIDARLDVLNLPFLFDSDEHLTAIMRGEEGADIRARIATCFEEAGIVMLGMFEPGFRQITSSKPINSVADLEGLLIRTPNTPVLMDSFTAWGASPTPLDFGELYTALQTKVVDAQENPYQLIYSSKFYEVQQYLCVTNHSTIVDQLQFSKIVWDSYPADVQEALREAAEYACNVGGDENLQKNGSLLDELSTLMTVTHMPDEEIAKMKQIAMDEIWPAYLVDDFTKDMVADIQALSR